MVKKILSIAAIFVSMNAVAQMPGLYDVQTNWSDKPVLHKVPDEFKDASAVYLLDHRIFEYKIENKDAVQYNYVHKLIKVTNDKGIEMFNKMYIPMYANSVVSDIKARVINAAGKSISVPADKIKEVEEEGRKYKLFAMEGIDAGSEVEYSYTLKKPMGMFGSEIFTSEQVPYVQAQIAIITPDNLKFDAKGFNGFTVMPDTVINGKRIIAGHAENIKELEDEKYGLRNPYLKRIDFKFSYNLNNSSTVESNTWKELARNIYSNLTNYSDKEKKAVNKFINGANIPANATDEQTVQLLEDYMKTKINTDENLVSADAENIETIIKTGNTDNFGITRFFIAMLENKGIKYQVAYPSIRDEFPLDEELENWNRIDETLIYFPATGKFLQPTGATLRYPFVEPFWSGTRGLFLKTTSIGDVKTAIGKFDSIPILPMEMSAHDMDISVKIDNTGDSLIIDSKQILVGYGAVSYRPIWAYLTKDKQDEAIKGIINGVAKSENIQNIKVENTKLTDAWDNKPLIISGTIHSADPLEKAGNKIIFKIGELIGKQEEMYQEKPRQLPAEVQYPHGLHRIIRFEIPAAYNVINLKDLLIDIQYKNSEGIVTMGFVSTYKVTGNMLEVDIMETYRDLKYPLSQFEMFKKVINAAADFNKIVLVLQKK